MGHRLTQMNTDLGLPVGRWTVGRLADFYDLMGKGNFGFNRRLRRWPRFLGGGRWDKE